MPPDKALDMTPGMPLNESLFDVFVTAQRA